MLDFAKQELAQIGMDENTDDDMNKEMRDHILRMVEEFSEAGHSGFSASYAVGILSKLLAYEPLTPLTGEDWEWTDLDYDDDMAAQNKRCSHVFKRRDGTAYDSEGIVWWEWFTDDDGSIHKSYFTSADSRVDITFPYKPCKKYKERK